MIPMATVTSAAIQYPEEWHLWKSEHGVTYTVRAGNIQSGHHDAYIYVCQYGNISFWK